MEPAQTSSNSLWTFASSGPLTVSFRAVYHGLRAKVSTQSSPLSCISASEMHNLQLTRRTYGQRFLHQGPEIPHLSVTLPNFFFFLHTIHVSHLLLHSSDSFSNCSDYSCSFPFLSSENHVSPDVLILAVCCKVKDVCWNILLIFPPKKNQTNKNYFKVCLF